MYPESADETEGLQFAFVDSPCELFIINLTAKYSLQITIKSQKPLLQIDKNGFITAFLDKTKPPIDKTLFINRW